MTFVSRASRHWRGGLVVALLIGGALAVRWTFFAGALYESRAVLEAQTAAHAGPKAAADEVEGAPPGAPAADLSIEQRLRDAIPELQLAELRGDQPSGPGSASVRQLNPQQVLFVCRDDDPRAAQQHCAELVGSSLSTLGTARIVTRPTRAREPLPADGATRAVVFLVSSLVGLFGGLAWMALRVRHDQPQALAEDHHHQLRPISSAPPPGRSHSMAPVAASPGGYGLSVRPPAADARSVRPPAEAHIAFVDVDPGWALDRSLTDAAVPKKLRGLCDQLYLAAAESCLVVGVSSVPEQRELKSYVAGQLAWLLSKSGQARILLLESDFDRPQIDRVMEVDAPPLAGFSQQLHARMLPHASNIWTVVRCTPTLSVLPEGRMRTPGMLYSQQLLPAVASLRRHFDIIVVDGPSVGHKSDVRAFESISDGIVFVSEDTTPEAIELADQWFRKKQRYAALSAADY